MHERPILSVVTVAFNAAKVIEPTLRSVCSRRDGIEYVVIDGSSTDGTLDIIGRYAKGVDVLVSEPDSGVYDAMNKGIDRCTGDWVVFMNAGDELNAGIHELSPFLDASAPFIYGNTLLVGADGSTRESIACLRNRFHLITGWGLWHQSILYNRQFIRHYDVSYRIVADTIMTYRVMSTNPQRAPRHANLFVSKYLAHDGLSVREERLRLQEEQRFLRAIRDEFPLLERGRYAAKRRLRPLRYALYQRFGI